MLYRLSIKTIRAMQLTLVPATSCISPVGIFALNLLFRHRADCDGLLYQPVKEFAPRARRPAIEPEGEFIQVIGPMRRTNRSLMRSQYPTFEQRSRSMRQRQQTVVLDRFAANRDVGIAFVFQPVVSTPPVRSDRRTRFHTCLNGLSQT